jgi:hypothetical protein
VSHTWGKIKRQLCTGNRQLCEELAVQVVLLQDLCKDVSGSNHPPLVAVTDSIERISKELLKNSSIA